MVATEKLEQIISKCRITKEVHTLPAHILGYYYADGSDYIILINKSITSDSNLYRTVLAEEIGHHMTTIGDCTPRKYMHYRDRITIDKQELLALKWAANFLIPTGMLLDALKSKIVSSLQELVDYFSVSIELIMRKIEFMARQRPIWDIDTNRYLYLYNYPSVHIYEKT